MTHRDVAEQILQRVGKSTKTPDDFEIKAADAMIAIAPNDPRCTIAYALRMATSSDSWQTQRDAMALGRFGAAAAEAVPYLVAAVRRDLGSPTSLEAITTLGMIGPAAKDAIPTLEKLTEHADPQIAERAKAALRQVRG